jgi:hypothetical protein
VSRFIERNELPTSYREQIVEFILQKTDGAVSTSAPSYNTDPFTGGGAYVPGAASNFPQPGTHQSYADPFTGAGGYVPGTPMDIDTSMHPLLLGITCWACLDACKTKLRLDLCTSISALTCRQPLANTCLLLLVTQTCSCARLLSCNDNNFHIRQCGHTSLAVCR